MSFNRRLFVDNAKAVVMFANEAHHLVSDALTELVEVFTILNILYFKCF